MALVLVTRALNRPRRSTNGAWVAGSVERDTFAIDESKLDRHFSLNSGILVEFADGTKESAYPFNGGAFPGYPPICYPANGRLSQLLAR